MCLKITNAFLDRFARAALLRICVCVRVLKKLYLLGTPKHHNNFGFVSSRSSPRQQRDEKMASNESITISMLTLVCVTFFLKGQNVNAFRERNFMKSSFIPRHECILSRNTISVLRRFRAGSTAELGEEYDVEEYDLEEYDLEDEEEEEEEEDSELSSSTIGALSKRKAKKKLETKKTISASLSKAKVKSKIKARKKPSLLRKIPYVIRALCNPVTLLAMTKGYFSSLVNLDYLQEVSGCSNVMMIAINLILFNFIPYVRLTYGCMNVFLKCYISTELFRRRNTSVGT